MSKAAQKEEYDLPKVHAAPTRHDVAVLANVSETIVSYVINKNRYVAAEKRKRVLEAVKKLSWETKKKECIEKTDRNNRQK